MFVYSAATLAAIMLKKVWILEIYFHSEKICYKCVYKREADGFVCGSKVVQNKTETSVQSKEAILLPIRIDPFFMKPSKVR